MFKHKSPAKHKDSERVPEIVTFLMYAFLTVIGFFVLAEFVLLGYWYFLPTNEVKTNIAEVPISLDSENVRVELEQKYREDLRAMRKMYENERVSTKTFYELLREELMAMHVPPSYRHYHLSLVILVDEIIDSDLDLENHNTVEKERQLSLLIQKYQ